ncbi:MAG: type II 3-dehydroquinate dehydratase [Desulfobacterales bacterium]|nr:type II 3-dehydroquinate dehydratase [Desulfobacterales bacterium]
MKPSDNPLQVLIIHGPNLNLLGKRETHIYGKTTLDDINQTLINLGSSLGFSIETFQSNTEGVLVERIQQAIGQIAGLIINPAAYTHTSIALRDAIVMLNVPVIEVHLSNIYKREAFRHHSMIADIATGQITGLGSTGYEVALIALAKLVLNKDYCQNI